MAADTRSAARAVPPRARARARVGVAQVALDQLCDCGDDAHERGLALAGDVRDEPAACDQHVEARRALERRAASDFEIPDAVGERSLTIAFGDVEGDRGCGLVEMLEYVDRAAALRRESG